MVIMYVQFELNNKLQRTSRSCFCFYFEVLGWDCIEVIGVITVLLLVSRRRVLFVYIHEVLATDQNSKSKCILKFFSAEVQLFHGFLHGSQVS